MLCVNANMTSGGLVTPYGMTTVQERIAPLGRKCNRQGDKTGNAGYGPSSIPGAIEPLLIPKS
jgi:hypothetical protein